MSTMSQAMRKANLGKSQVQIVWESLRTLEKDDNAVTSTKLATYCNMPLNRVSGLLGYLNTRGMAFRRKDKEPKANSQPQWLWRTKSTMKVFKLLPVQVKDRADETPPEPAESDASAVPDFVKAAEAIKSQPWPTIDKMSLMQCLEAYIALRPLMEPYAKPLPSHLVDMARAANIPIP